MFKIGDKVFFVDNGDCHKDCNKPPQDKILIVKDFVILYNLHYYILEGYEFDLNGLKQGFREIVLRKADESFAEGVLEKIKTKIKEEELETV